MENLNIFRHGTIVEMMQAVADKALASSVVTIAGTLYRQGERNCFQTALDLRSVALMTQANRPKGKSTDVESVKKATNRPLDPTHAKKIGQYIIDAAEKNQPYILPSLTLNFDDTVELHTIESEAATKAAIMILPVGVRLEITDGQHRAAGIEQAVKSVESCGTDAIGVMITFTDDHAQVHQDFADCAKTKAISQSQLTVYDRRNPANGLAIDLVEQCPLFKHTVDASKQSVSIRSTAVWTTNQIRVLLKWALIGRQCSDDQFSENARKVLGDRGTQEYGDFLGGLLNTLRILSETNSVLHKLSKLEQATRDTIPAIREESDSLLMTGTGFAILGYLWWLIRNANRDNPLLDTEMMVRRVAALDWSASSVFFKSNVKMNPERTQSGQKYVREAGDLMWSAIQ